MAKRTGAPLEGDANTGSRVTILTGATGFLGREILDTILARSRDEQLLVTVRSADRPAVERLRELLTRMYPDEERRADASARVQAIEADLSRGALELTAHQRDLLSGSTCRIIHGAATVKLDHSLEEAREINVGGTRRMLDLAELVAEIANLERFAYIGTAYVAGLRTGTIYEDDLDVGQELHNTYERSKLESEELVRSYRDRLPISIFRPSIVAGHSTTGFTTSFKTIYWPIKVFTSGIIVCVPGDPHAHYDLVPVDFVAQALLHILDRNDSVGTCYHLTSSRPVTLDRAMRLAAVYFGVKRIPAYVSPRLFFAILRPILYLTLWGRWREGLTKSRALVPYLTSHLEFDNGNTTKALEGSGITVPEVETYLETLFRWIKETDWGRKSTGR